MSCLGIIAGSGGLPKKIIETCQREQRPFFVLGFKGQADESIISGVPHAWIKLGETTKTVNIMKKQGVDRLVMAGGIRRPSFFDIKPDMRTLKFFMRMGTKAFGDDRILRGVVEELEKDGFQIVGAHEIVPDLLTPMGILGKVKPSTEDQDDIDFGIELTKALGRMDVGQAAVIQRGITLGVEAVEGTDALLKRCATLRRAGSGGVLIKSCKPQQDKRVDIPTIGTRTVRHAHEAKLSGIAVEAGASFIIDREDTIALANKLGIFIVGFDENHDRK